MMDPDTSLSAARAALTAAQDAINHEIRFYPTPISGCDAQFNRLLEMRQSVGRAVSALEAPAFVPTPRQLVATSTYESR